MYNFFKLRVRKKFILLLLISIIFINFSAFCSGNYFLVATCEDHINETINEKLIFFRSDYGFIYTEESRSPLQQKIPERVGLNTKLYSESVAAIVVQEIQTNDLGRVRMEGGVSEIYYYLLAILGAIIGLIVANFNKQNPIFGLLIGGFAGYLFAIFVFRNYYEDDFSFTIDNATNQEISIHFIDLSDSIVLPKKSQITVIINEGERMLTSKNTLNNRIIESLSINAKKYKIDDEFIKGYYVYNIDNKNSYLINFANYGPD